jgi:hypothetical protein
MDGKMTIYTDEGAFGGTDAVKGEIKKAMNVGDFNAIPSIVNVLYVDDTATAPIEEDKGSGTQSTPTDYLVWPSSSILCSNCCWSIGGDCCLRVVASKGQCYSLSSY